MKKARRKKESIKNPSRKKKKRSRQKESESESEEEVAKKKKKKLIKCRTTYRKNQNNLNLYRVNRI